MTPIAWTVIDPDTIERIIAVGLCRRHKHARRIKPSQGDGGLDVLVPVPGQTHLPLHVENYQVKKFADELNDSRKQQIKKSLARAIATHNETTFDYKIAKWYLALPMDLTREQERWLLDLADELEAPFPVEVFGLTAVEELLLDAPNVREYYLGDGMERVSQLLSQMSTLAGLRNLVTDPPKVAPADATGSLADLHAHINAADPHFEYNYQVTTGLPPVTQEPGLIASVISHTGHGSTHVTWHVFAKYDAALEDRPIPGSYTVYPDRMSPEQRTAWERWRKYGTPVVLGGDAVAEVTLDLPGGLAPPGGGNESVLKLGPAFGYFEDEPTTPVLWVIEDPNGVRLAERTFNFRLAARGHEGGEHRQGGDTDGYITADMYIQMTSAAGGTMEGGLSLRSERWVGEPVQRVLPALRFCAAWGNGNHLKMQDEFRLGDPVFVRTLHGDPPVPAVVVSVVEDLVRISAATRRPIELPEDLSTIAGRGGSSLRTIADVVSGLEVGVRVDEVVLWYEDHPEAYADLTQRASSGSLQVPWSVPFPPFGEDFEFTFLLEIHGAVTLEPQPPSEGQPATRKAARVILTDTTLGRLRLHTDHDQQPERRG
ncbi:hypothetical protein [Ornithinimicrobium sufpigmenti]|uniref:hypothetical protein n=1 Tax=Ornithinimicrobium sufpigmenti TaxID=2508882 RepID=UPI00103567DD|nr:MULTISPECIES: hypothetical protein [unclassified Ornithinimicrobium]